MAEAKTLPLAVACNQHAKAMEEARGWGSLNENNSQRDMATYMAGFDIGWTQCLKTLHESGYIIRGGSQPANPDKAKRRQRQQTERLLRDVERQCENL
jgi:hypothetical protein